MGFRALGSNTEPERSYQDPVAEFPGHPWARKTSTRVHRDEVSYRNPNNVKCTHPATKNHNHFEGDDMQLYGRFSK